MKLVLVLMLTALPLLCYADLGCPGMGEFIFNTIAPAVSKYELTNYFRVYLLDGKTELSIWKFKQCFLDQNNQTLNNVLMMMGAVAESKQCASY